jgi:hypothetical protein
MYNQLACKFNKKQSPPLAIMYYIMVYIVSDLVFLPAGRKVGSYPDHSLTCF